MANYNFNLTDGNTTYSSLNAGDTITFATGFNQENFSFLKDGDDLLIYADNGANLRLENQFLSSPLVYTLIFDGNVTMDLETTNIMVVETSNEIINGTLNDDTIYGGDGDNSLYGGNGNDTIYGGAGDDMIAGNDGTDTLYGGTGNDLLQGGDGDYLYGGEGNDTLRGFGGEEAFNGGTGNDLVWWRDYQNTSNNGIDANLNLETATDGNGNLATLSGIENLIGSVYADTLRGDDTNNVIRGGANRFGLTDGDDVIYGNGGDDMLYGDAGADTLIGGRGADTLYGGASDGASDTFKFSSDEDSTDGIVHFEYGTDKIDISDLLFGYINGLSDIEDFVDISHVGNRFDIRIDNDGGGFGYVTRANVYTDIADTLTAQDLLDNGTLIAELSPF